MKNNRLKGIKGFSFGLAPGFTLIELLTVIAIIGILSSIVVAGLYEPRQKAKEAMAGRNVKELNQAISLFDFDYGRYPGTAGVEENSQENSDTGWNQGDGTLYNDLVPKYLTRLPTDSLITYYYDADEGKARFDYLLSGSSGSGTGTGDEDEGGGDPDPIPSTLTCGEEIKINNSYSAADGPDIHGDKIVYSDFRNGNHDIYLYDLVSQTETQITTNSSNQRLPKIYGNKIVWYDYRDSSFGDIYLYDLTNNTERKISNFEVNYFNLDIFGDKVVYDRNPIPQNVYIFNTVLDEETKITNNVLSVEFSHPIIYENTLVYSKRISSNDYDLYSYDLINETETKLLIPLSQKYLGAIYQDKIVYSDFRNGNADIYMYNLTNQTETQITTNLTDQHSPDIDGNKIVWYDYRYGNADVYLYNLSSQVGIRVTTSLANQLFPKIYNNKIFWFSNGGIFYKVCQDGF
ncbi:MAG: prepilin-type N-terminal cleavage/methylation domain-containing protein [Candidatus Paceibacterota bacterium]